VQPDRKLSAFSWNSEDFLKAAFFGLNLFIPLETGEYLRFELCRYESEG
jgi:hypothetical protein